MTKGTLFSHFYEVISLEKREFTFLIGGWQEFNIAHAYNPSTLRGRGRQIT